MTELFENLGINWKLLLAQAVNFLLVLWLLNKFVFKKLLKFLEERKERISKGLVFSERAKQELQRVEQARHLALGQARREGEMLIAEAKNLAQKQENEVLAAAKAKHEEILKKASEEGVVMKEQMVREAKIEMQKSAVAIAEKILQKTIAPKDQDRFLKEALKAL
ncbi:MAG: F0F1 ATP synthase subunit B [Candidatus Wildermuthbacteria bacterium]|nr:F0F1 ATP synthase subunit B [Candidatus Wildermuthbacteria bacterium]